jgi:spore germination protein YaaH
LKTNEWVWDNIPANKKQELRERPKRYQVYQLDFTKEEEWHFASLEDAVAEANKWENSYIVNTRDHKKVFSNEHNYFVYQNKNYLEGFVSIDEAIAYAKRWAHGRIITATNREVWNNYPYYQVHEENKKAVEFITLQEALNYGLEQPKAWITTYREQLIWDNSNRLKFWTWTGSATDTSIKNLMSQTVGIDVISPTWFKLTDASGNIEDTSSTELLKWLHARGIKVHPLVHNQFNSKLTTQFLSSASAQEKFIKQLVDRAAQIGLDGLNIDFESLSGSDRAAYTLFIKNLTAAAHKKDLIISIDLPRGSIAWNDKTAFDHKQLATIVDYIVTMTYDHHYSGSTTPGSVAGMQWTEQGVVEFLSYGIPRDKLIMGIPFYIREWKLDNTGKLVSNRAITSKTVNTLLETKKTTSTWDPKFNQYRIEYKEDGFTYLFWMEDESSVKTRLDIAKKYKLAGVAAWRLGQESPDLWKSMILDK